jgi:Zn-dependent metalloprotease
MQSMVRSVLRGAVAFLWLWGLAALNANAGELLDRAFPDGFGAYLDAAAGEQRAATAQGQAAAPAGALPKRKGAAGTADAKRAPGAGAAIDGAAAQLASSVATARSGAALPAPGSMARTPRGEAASAVSPSARLDQASAVAKLRASVADASGADIKFSDKGTPSLVAAANLADPLSRSPTKRAIARSVLSAQRELLRLADPDLELTVEAETVDTLGITRVRYRQTYLGLPVFAQELSVYVEPDGRATRLSGRWRPTPQLRTIAPTLSMDEARQAATVAALRDLHIRTTELVVLAADDTNDMALAWHVEGYADVTRGWHFFFDAHSGALLRRYSAVQRAAVPASGQDLDNATVSFTAWSEGGTFYAIDVTKPGNAAGGTINDKVGNIFIFDCKGATALSSCMVASSSSTTAGWAPAAVSAMSEMYRVTDYYLGTHGRKAIDDNNAAIRAVVNFGGEAENAFWSSASSLMVFGIGGSTLRNLARLDIAAHEMTHGVTDATAGLVYQGQSGALNESMSDFFAMMIKNSGWMVGVEATVNPPLRNMADPHQGLPSCPGTPFAQPKHMDEYVVLGPDSDHGGVHCNSGIPNRALYLLAEGLSAEGLGASVGRQHAEQIVYYALTQLLHQSDQFLDVRRQMIVAAQVKYGAGSPDVAAVGKAFDSVGILEPQVTPSTGAIVPTDGNPINAQSWLVYRRNDGALMAETGTSTVGPINVYPANTQRPGIVWNPGSNSADIFYINAQTGSLRSVNTVSGTDSLVFDGSANRLYAFAISPSTSKIAFTFESSSQLYLGDLDTGQTTGYQPQMPNLDGTASDAGIDVYSPGFDYLSENVIFDFTYSLVALDGSTARPFSFGTLNLLTRQFDTVATGQPATIQVLNPVFATNNNYVIAYDVVSSVSASQSGVAISNLTARKQRGLTGLDLSGQNRLVLGWPTFNRDDSALLFQTRNTVSGTDHNPFRVYSSAVAKGGDGAWSPGTSVSAVSTVVGSGYAQTLIRGSRASVVHPSYTGSPAQLQFASTAVGALSRLPLTLANTGDVDITIVSIAATGDFRSPSTNHLLPRGKSIDILVNFVPTVAGSRTGTLTIASGAGNKTVALAGTATGAQVVVSPVIEFYNQSLDHYFITWVPDEIAKLDAGTTIKGWARTGRSFNTYRTATAGTSPVCRFYIPPNLGDSHFFGRGTAECNETGAKNPTFVLEDPAFMQMFLPASGTCPAGTVQVYRVFSARKDANHRYMTDKALRAQMVAKGWVAEGDGPDLVAMCAPA